MLSEVELQAIMAREKAATKGPWEEDVREERSHERVHHAVFTSSGVSIFDTLNSEAQTLDHDGDGVYFDRIGRANMDFCAHARTDIPRLLADLSALRRVAEAGKRLRNDAIVLTDDTWRVLNGDREAIIGGDFYGFAASRWKAIREAAQEFDAALAELERPTPCSQ